MRKLDKISIKEDNSDKKKKDESIYYKIVDFAAEVHMDRAQKAFEKGNFSSMEEALSKTPVPNIMSIVKNIAMKKPVSASSLEEKCAAMNYVVTRIMDITPEQFYAIWSTEFNKKYSLYPTINAIAKEAPIEIKKQCYFDSKMIFFKVVWPNMYEKHITNIESKFVGKNIYYASDSMKAGLIRAGNTISAAKGKKSVSYGREVDEILMNAINDVVFDYCEFTTAKQIFNLLGEDSKSYFDKKSFAKGYPGICEIIEARGYPSLLDFYYLQSDPHIQKTYASEFLLYRKKWKLPKEELLEVAIEQFLEMEREKEMEKE